MLGRPILLITEPVKMMRPRRRSIMPRTASRARVKQAVRLRSRTRRQSSVLNSTVGLRMLMPELPIRMSRPPCAAIIASIAARPPASSVASNGAISASSPASRSSLAFTSSVDESRPLRKIWAPASAKPLAMAKPRPRDAPVTRAVRPVSENISCMASNPFLPPRRCPVTIQAP